MLPLAVAVDAQSFSSDVVDGIRRGCFAGAGPFRLTAPSEKRKDFLRVCVSRRNSAGRARWTDLRGPSASELRRGSYLRKPLRFDRSRYCELRRKGDRFSFQNW